MAKEEPKNVPEATTKPGTKPTVKKSASVLESVGKAAMKEHGLSEAFVTSDGAVFRYESDAKNHAANLSNKSILNVKK